LVDDVINQSEQLELGQGSQLSQKRKKGDTKMSNYYDSPQYGSVPTAYGVGDVAERTTFIRKTYAHVLGAVVAFIGIEAVLLNSGLAEGMIRAMAGSRWAPVIVIGAFMAVTMIAQRWAAMGASKPMQYLGLSLYVVAEAVIFLPILYVADNYFKGQNIIPAAALITLTIFGGLTAITFMTRADFSFMGRFLCLAGLAAFGLVLCSAIFGFSLGLWFPFAMVVLMSGYILYETSNIMLHYPTEAYVAAALALFASLATLFYYVLRIVMAFSSRD
jgi:uncharacterized protein